MKPRTIIQFVSTADEDFGCRMSRPDENGRMNLFLTFNPFAYSLFIKAIEDSAFVNRVYHVKAYDDERLAGGMAVELIHPAAFEDFFRELPDMLLTHVVYRMANPVKHLGTKENEN